MTTRPRSVNRFRHLHLAILAGTAIGLAGTPARLALAEPPDEELATILYQLAMLSPEEFAELMDDPAAAPESQDNSAPAPKPSVDNTVYPVRDDQGRVIKPDEPTPLAFKNVSLEQIIPFIVEATGKVVLPMPDVLSLRITVLNDQKIPRAKALEMVFLALQQNGVGVVETNELINLRSIAELDKGDIPVIPGDKAGDQELMKRSKGTIVCKIFSLRYSSAANVAEMFKTSLPSFAKMTFDGDSNQVVVTADVGLLQRMQTVIRELDVQSSAALETETFALKFADAADIATNIRDLYAPQQGQNRGGNNNNPLQQFFQNRGGGGGNQGRPGGGGGNQPGATRATPTDAMTSQNLRVTANGPQNAVTVLAEKPVLEQIRKQIKEQWDIGAESIKPHVYELKNSDPVKMRDVLISMFGSPGAQRQGNTAQASAANRLYGRFSFEAIPEMAKLVVIAKNQSDLDEIDKIITSLDLPQKAGLPQIVELKHADAEQLAEQLNSLLAREGTIAQVTKAQTGLTTGSATGVSPFATSATQNQATSTQQNTQNQVWLGWWGRSQPSTTTAGSGNLVGKIRIVPVWRQNALMILSPPEYQDSLHEVITTLDSPGRQVLLSAIIAEINIEDATALGLRWSNSAITPSKTDNVISFGPSVAGTTAGGTITGQKNDLLPGLFTNSVLNLGVNINALIQALGEKTSVNILSEPRIFTSDNQQAEFFSGQDIPFITESQPNTQGNVVNSFDYRAVGIALRVRPRITVNKDVDININLELSSTQPGNTLFGGAIVDRRETTTHLIVKDGQTVVVSGILRTEDNDTHRKIPILGDLPWGLGAPFNSIERTKTKSELIAFVTPYVIGSENELRNVDKADQDRLNTMRERLRNVNDLDRDPKKVEPPPRSPGEQTHQEPPAPPPTPIDPHD